MNKMVEIKIESLLDENWEGSFPGMKIDFDGACTRLTGFVADESSLHGILNQIRDLNLKLISVNPL